MTCTNPYVGPRPFEEGDSLFFFGREGEARDLLSLVISKRLTLLYAPSGAGKSSLINTRLIPGLQQEGFYTLPVGRVSGELPEGITEVNNVFIFNLLLKLDKNQTKAENLTDTTLIDYLEDSMSKSAVTGKDNVNEKSAHVLIIDQFEEIITTHLERWQDREEFFQQLRQAMTDDPRLWMVLVVREDYVAALEPYADILADRMRTRFYMQHMGRQAALDAIRKPADKCGRPFNPDVAESLVDNLRRIRIPGEKASQLGEFVEPVQLQVVCYRLWENLNLREPPPTQITFEDLEELGNVDAALAEYYEEVLKKTIHETDVSEIELRDWFDHHLITEARTRGIVYQGEDKTVGLDNNVVQLMADQFLLRAEIRSGATWYELVHDRFIEPILQANQAWWLYQSQLIRAAKAWKEMGADRSKLYLGQQLRDAEASLEELERVPSMVAEFIAASRAENQKRRRTYLAVGVLNALLLLSLGAVMFGVLAQQKAGNAFTAARTAQADKATAEEAARAARKEAEVAQEQQEDAQRAAEDAQRVAKAAQADKAAAEEAARAAQEDATVAQMEVNEAKATATVILQEANERLARAISLQLAIDAINNLKTDPELSILLAKRALSFQNTPEAENALHQALRASRIQLRLEHGSEVFSVAFNYDGDRLATVGEDETIKIWDATTGENLLTLSKQSDGSRRHFDQINSIAFSSDGRHLATASGDGTAKLWDLDSGQVLLTVNHEDVVAGVAFSPDGTRMATASWDGTATIWDINSGQKLQTLSGHEGKITDIAFHPEGRLVATASSDTTAKIWDAESGAELQTLGGHTSILTSIAFSPNGEKLATASWDFKVNIWDIINEETPPLTLSGHTLAIFGVTFSPDSTLVATASADGTAKVWDAESGQEQLTLIRLGHDSQVTDVAFSPDGSRLATASLDGTAKVWNISFEQELLTFLAHDDIVYSVTFSPDDERLATSSRDGTVRIWNTSGEELQTLSGHTDRVLNVTFNSDGTRLATASGDNTVKIWDAISYQELFTLSGHTDWVYDVAFSPDGTRLATASGDNTIRIWNAATGEELLTLSRHNNRVVDITFSSDGSRLASASWDGTAKIWDTTAFAKEEVTLSGHNSEVSHVAFSPDGELLATASTDRTIRIWDLTGQELAILTGHAHGVSSVVFDRNGVYLATASGDNTVKVWDATSYQELFTLSGHTKPVTSIAFNSGGTHLTTTGNDGTVRLYTLDVEELIELAQERVTRELTPKECRQYLSQDECSNK